VFIGVCGEALNRLEEERQAYDGYEDGGQGTAK
jgi:hypothetical protein